MDSFGCFSHSCNFIWRKWYLWNGVTSQFRQRLGIDECDVFWRISSGNCLNSLNNNQSFLNDLPYRIDIEDFVGLNESIILYFWNHRKVEQSNGLKCLLNETAKAVGWVNQQVKSWLIIIITIQIIQTLHDTLHFVSAFIENHKITAFNPIWLMSQINHISFISFISYELFVFYWIFVVGIFLITFI